MAKKGADVPPRIAKMDEDGKPTKLKNRSGHLGKGCGVDGQNKKGTSKKKPFSKSGTSGFGDGRTRC